MFCKPLWLCLFLCCSSVLLAQDLAEREIHFASDSDVLSVEAQQTLNELVQLTKQSTEFTIELKGHTDLDGSLGYNEDLSRRRNQSVRQYLQSQGVATTLISEAAFGERLPAVAAATEQAKAQNRRVEISLQYHQVSSVDEMLKHFAKKRQQRFPVDATLGGEIVAADGTIVRIPANAFVDDNGHPIEGPVDLVIEEAIRPSAMIFHQLNTSHGDQDLSTGGMIRLSASLEGQPVHLATDRQLDVFVPTESADPTMRLYDGARDEAGAMTWEEIASPVNIMTAAEVNAEPVPFPTELFTALDHLQVDIPAHPGRLSELPLPAIPKMAEPATPRMKKPYKPGLPQRQEAKAPKGLFAKMKYDATKAQQKLDQQYEERMAKYEKRMKNYEAAMILYQENGVVYQAELAEIEAAYAIEKALVIEERKAKIQDWLARCYAYEAAYQLQDRIQFYKKDLSEKTIHEKLYPNRKTQRLPTFQFNISLRALEFFARGEQTPANEDPQYSKYILAATDKAGELYTSSGLNKAWSEIKTAYRAYQQEKAQQLRAENSKVISGLTDQLNYYGYQVSAPNFSRWCNIDTPIPVGQALLAFDNSRFTEIFTFVPTRKMVSYFPMTKIKTAFFPLGQEVNYLAFRYINDGIQLSSGSIKPASRERLSLEYVPSSLAEVEQAILALDVM